MRNIETLRNYFLGKDPQLKETMADNSLRLIGIPGRHFVLRSELVKRLKELRDYVDEKDTDLRDAIDALAQTVDDEIERLETKWDITENVRIYDLDNGVYRVLTPEIKLYYKQNSNFINDDDLVLVKEDRAFFAFSRVPGQDHPTIVYGIADANDGWYQTLRMEDIEKVTNKKDTITQSSTYYPSTLAVYNALLNYYTKDQVDQLISIIPTFDIEVVQVLPTEDISETTIYLVPSQDPQTANSYDEFIYVSNNWEQIGSTAIDLSNYYTKAETDSLVSGFQPEITSSNKLSSDLIDDTNHTNKLVTTSEKTTWNNAIRGAGTNGSGILYLVDGTNILTQVYSSRFYYAFAVFKNGTQLAPISFPSVFLVYTTQGANENVLHIINTVPRFTDTVDIEEWTISQDTTNFVWGNLQVIYKPKEIPTLSGTVHMTDLAGGMYYLAAGASVDDGNSNVLFSAGPGAGGSISSATRVGILKVAFSYYVSGRNTHRLWNYYYYSDVTEGLITYGRVKKTNSGTPTSTSNTLTLSNIKTTAFTGTDGTTAGTIGLVPAPATTDAGKFLCADGTWQTSSGGTTITYGTTDLTPGVSPLADGEFYFCYE